MILFLDIETRGAEFAGGVYRYAQAGAEPILVQWAVDHSPVVVHEWPVFRLQETVDRADRVVIHGSEFDATVLAAHKVIIPMGKQWCTMAQARQHGLPGGLDRLCEIFKIPQDQAKMREGRALINLFCKPNKKGAYNDKTSHPQEWAAFCEYAARDVLAMRELYHRMPAWNCAVERRHFELDRKINQRGVRLDLLQAQGFVRALKRASDRDDARTMELTGHAVESARQRDRLLVHLAAAHDVWLPDLTASTIERRLQDETLPDEVKELLKVRLASARASPAKYAAVLKSACADGRARGMLVYCGAARTGRWSHRTIQLGNMPRPTIPPELMHLACGALGTGIEDLILPDEVPMSQWAADCVRGLIVAAPGHELLVADYASVESRFAAWVAGEGWKVEAFRGFDAGKGPDQYKLAYARLFGSQPESVTKAQRQVGKVVELMLAYGGSVAAFVTGALNYGLDLAAVAAACAPGIPQDVRRKAHEAYERARDGGRDKALAESLGEKVYMTCWALTRLWRSANSAIEAFWHDMERAVDRVLNGTRFVDVGRVRVDREGSWVRIRLPQGRYLCYPDMRRDADGLSFLGVSPYTHQWTRIRTHGGKLLENVCQAGTRDILSHGLANLDADGWHPVMHIHDEPICEEPAGTRTVAQMVRLITDIPGLDGLPLAASGFVAQRYYKEL